MITPNDSIHNERVRYVTLNASQGGTPEAIAEQLGLELPEVHYLMAGLGIDWAPPSVGPGRPQKPLLVGQQLYTEAAYHAQIPRTTIAHAVRAPLVRVKRHLIGKGMHLTGRYTNGRLERHKRLLTAISQYLEGKPVLEICKDTRVPAPTLYAALRARNVPLRTRRAELEPVNDETELPNG